MAKRPFNIWVVSPILSSVCGRLTPASAALLRFKALLFAIPTLLEKKRTAFATGSVTRSNVALEHVSFVLVGDYPTSVISGDFDRYDRHGKFSPCSTNIVRSKPMAVDAADGTVYLHLDLSVADQESDDISILMNNGRGGYLGSARVIFSQNSFGFKMMEVKTIFQTRFIVRSHHQHLTY